jgi:hypothetical protein
MSYFVCSCRWLGDSWTYLPRERYFFLQRQQWFPVLPLSQAHKRVGYLCRWYYSVPVQIQWAYNEENDKQLVLAIVVKKLNLGGKIKNGELLSPWPKSSRGRRVTSRASFNILNIYIYIFFFETLLTRSFVNSYLEVVWFCQFSLSIRKSLGRNHFVEFDSNNI